jgi:hypothetical protein
MVCHVTKPLGFSAGIVGAPWPSASSTGCMECRHPSALYMKDIEDACVSMNRTS